MPKKSVVTAVDILKYARALLAKRGGWTKDVWARDKYKNDLDPECIGAVCFCMGGAFIRTGHDLKTNWKVMTKAEHALLSVLPEDMAIKDFASFNDTQKTKTPVLKAFDRAIAKLEAKHA